MASLRERILDLVERYYMLHKAPVWRFERRKPYVPVSGKVYKAEEMMWLVQAALDFQLTHDYYCDMFERRLKNFFSAKGVVLVNSGSSANLLALASVIEPGDEVVVCVVSFPTTVNPIVQLGAVPVFVDVDLNTLNVDVSQLEEAISPKTEAIILAHTLGNPFNVREVLRIAIEHNLVLIEDNCDALGSTYKGKATGSFGDLSTLSFYPAHHITTGEGGAVIVNKLKLLKKVRSLAGWGRDCWCLPGRDNTCGRRFEWKFEGLPAGYDHKYVYSSLGFNLKMTEMQAAIGVVQLGRLRNFTRARRENWAFLRHNLREYEKWFIFQEPEPDSEPSWFGFAMTRRKDAPFTLRELEAYLNERGVQTRRLFAGNLVRHPAYHGVQCRIVGDLKNADYVMENTLWIGCFPGLTHEHLNYVLEVFRDFSKEL